MGTDSMHREKWPCKNVPDSGMNDFNLKKLMEG